MTITRAKGEGNGHFYHIEVIDLPFHTIPFVSCFISLIENTKNELLLKIYKQIWDNLRASKFTGQSIFSFAYYASFDAPLCARQPRAVRADNDNGRRLSSQDYAWAPMRSASMCAQRDKSWPPAWRRCYGDVTSMHKVYSLTYFWFYCTAHAALCATHIGFMCIMTQNGRVTHGPWNSWWNYIMIMKWYGLSNMKVYGTILVWVI